MPSSPRGQNLNLHTLKDKRLIYCYCLEANIRPDASLQTTLKFGRVTQDIERICHNLGPTLDILLI